MCVYVRRRGKELRERGRQRSSKERRRKRAKYGIVTRIGNKVVEAKRRAGTQSSGNERTSKSKHTVRIVREEEAARK